MSERKLVTLRQLPSGQSGKVAEIRGGHGLINRLNALGVRPGKRLTKVSAMLMRGPVTIQLGNARMAVGFGMADKIIVELEES